MKTLLITGGAGFIGSNFVRMYLQKYKSDCIVNLDALTYAGNLKNLKDVEKNKNHIFIHGNICDKKMVNDLFCEYKFDGVIHFAAESHVDRSIENPNVFVKTNVLGTQILLECAKSHWMVGKDEQGYPKYREGVKFLQISTDEVYGSLTKDAPSFLEGSPLKPNSPYAASKAASDMLVNAYSSTFHLPVNITRCSNNYGINQNREKLIPLMIHNCKNDISLPVYGRGMQIRDWIHVEDHCEAIDKVFCNGEIGETYNIGANNEKANIEIVKLIVEKCGKNESLIHYVEDRLGHDFRYGINSDKIRARLGWKPRMDFHNGICFLVGCSE